MDLILNQEYVPKAVGKIQKAVPEYIHTSKNYGPKPLTIEEYKPRPKPRVQIAPPEIKKKRGRVGQ